MQSFSLPSKPASEKPSFLKPSAPKTNATSATARIQEQLGELQQSAMNLALPMSAHVRRSSAPLEKQEKPRPVNPFEATVKTLGTSVIEKNEDRFTQAAQELLSKQQSGEQTLFQEAIKKAQQEATKEREELFRKANAQFIPQPQPAPASNSTSDVFEKLNSLKKQLEQENNGIQSKVQQGNAKISQSMSGLADQAALAGQLKDQLQKWEQVAAQVDTFTNTTDKLANIGEMFKDGLDTIHTLGGAEEDVLVERFPYSTFLDATTLSWCRQSESQRSLKENKVIISQTQNGLDAVDLQSDQNTVYWLGSTLNKQINKMAVFLAQIEGGEVKKTFVLPKESYAKRVLVVNDSVYILSSIKEKKTMISALTKLRKSDLVVETTFGSEGSMFFSSDLFENSMSIQMSVDSTQTKMVILARATAKADLSVKSVLTVVLLEKGIIEKSDVLQEKEGEMLVTDMCFTSENDLLVVGIRLFQNESKPFVMKMKDNVVVFKQELPSDFFPKKVMETKEDYKVLVLTKTNGNVLSLDKTTMSVISSTPLTSSNYVKTSPENWFYHENELTIVGSIQRTDSKKSSDSFTCTLGGPIQPINIGNNFYQCVNALTQLQDGKMMYSGITDQNQTSQSRVGLLFEMK
jgi:hypothetical protein